MNAVGAVPAWLREALSSGPVESAHIKALAEQAGIGPKALRNAREQLGIVATRRGSGKAMRSAWSLPAEGLGHAGPPAPEIIRAPSKAPALSRLTKVCTTFTPTEQDRTRRRVPLFRLRGMTEADAHGLASRLVLERDRGSGPAVGSCIECQAYVRHECTIAKPAVEMHECWLRRHDAP